MQESLAEARLHAWLSRKGMTPRKGVDVDCEAWRGPRVCHLYEVKGDQRNYGARRQSFLVGLGQILVARSHSPGVRATLALTSEYMNFVDKYADVLLRENIGVLKVGGRIVEVPLSRRRPSFRALRQGHPDGQYFCGTASYRVTHGKIAWAKVDGKVLPDLTFVALCRVLGIRSRFDSAARVLSRRSTKRGKHT